MIKLKFSILIFLFLFAIPIAFARSGEITLLTVGEVDNQTFGGTANLKLEIKPGSGRVFIDSFPLTQLDTQISTRFGKEVACSFLNVNCDEYDFFYTIRASSALVGGPSAGAATTILTISVLDNVPLNKDTVMTGTINGGGIIGPVSGIEEKSIAAKNKGFKKVLLPKWSVLSNENNTTLYASSLKIEGIEIITVSSLEEALWHFTNKNYEKPVQEFKVPDKYTQTMGEIAGDLCRRHFEMFPLGFNQSNESLENAKNAMERGDFYSAASFCFGANVAASNFLIEDLSIEEKNQLLEELKIEIQNFSNYINSKPLVTFSDLEASVIVKERLLEAKTASERNNSINNLAYIRERYYSAVAWAKFFDYESKELNLDEIYLSNACNSKIAEVEERLNYLEFLSGSRGAFSNELKETRDIANKEDFAFCLFRATRIKADINALLITAMVGPSSYDDLAYDKLALAYKQLSTRNEFSILGYSYFDYSNSLKDSNPELSIIFSEYATEFSNLDMYFPSETSKIKFSFYSNPYFAFGFFLGLLVSFIAIFLTILIRNYKPRKAKSSPGKKR